jgi:hypothetical protein
MASTADRLDSLATFTCDLRLERTRLFRVKNGIAGLM